MNIPSLYKSNSYVNFLRLTQTIPKMVTSSPRWLPGGVESIPKMVTLPPQDGYLTACKPLPHKDLRNLKVLNSWCSFKNNNPRWWCFLETSPLCAGGRSKHDKQWKAGNQSSIPRSRR